MKIAIGPPAAEVRRQVGPTAWAVLEAIVEAAHPGADGLLAAATNLRELAAVLGLSKDTVGSALARLARAGIVERRPQRASSRFAGSSYVVVGSTGLKRIDCPKLPCPETSDAETPHRQTTLTEQSPGHTRHYRTDTTSPEPLRLFE